MKLKDNIDFIIGEIVATNKTSPDTVIYSLSSGFILFDR